MAAVLACGGGAALSHLSAASLWGMFREAPRTSDELPLIHVTVGGEGKSRPGIRVHRSATFSPADVTRRFGIPVTKPARTLGDLRRTVSDRVFAAALRQAEFLGLPVGDRWKTDRTRGELEARFLTLLRRHRLPQPEVNVHVDRFVVDFHWRAERLIVELDGWGAHRSRSAFEADRARDIRLKVLGYEVLRLTWRQVTGDPAGSARAIRQLLTAFW